MPEYLAPGVFVEETSFRAKTIEGVPTSTTGFCGRTRTGPVSYPGGPAVTEPRLITSFTEFERVYGGLENLDSGVNLTAHGARSFFENGGKRLYISRVYKPTVPDDPERLGLAKAALMPIDGGGSAQWIARWPGTLGNVHVQCDVVRSRDLAGQRAGQRIVPGAFNGMTLERYDPGTPASQLLAGSAPPDPARLLTVDTDPAGVQHFRNSDGDEQALDVLDVLISISLRVTVAVSIERRDVYSDLWTAPEHRRNIGRILQLENPEDEDAAVWLSLTPATPAPGAIPLLLALTQAAQGHRLTGGDDGTVLDAAMLEGREADPDDVAKKATGLEALAEIEDIAIVAAPDIGTVADDEQRILATGAVITHAELQRYRIAVIDGPPNASLTKIREFRGLFDSKYAALYHPWIETLNPLERPAQGAPPQRILLPPSGFVTGIYGRSDIERGVFKAPANEVVRGLTRFEVNINKGRQEVINPEGINALRFFEGRGNRVWGARTMSSDPEWKYVNVRRLFIFLEHSIDKATQWAVFEPNNQRLWSNIRQTIEDFLIVQWRDGALMGNKPEEAFFVRCDRTTMTQNDLDNGRLICLIGVAPTYPAEFVIFRIGQWTADSKLAA